MPRCWPRTSRAWPSARWRAGASAASMACRSRWARSLVASGTTGPVVHRTLRVGTSAGAVETAAGSSWSGVLALQPLVVVLDAAALASGQPLPEAQEQALEAAGMLLLNKSEALDATQRCAVRARLPVLPLRWSVRGHLALRDLPTSVAGEGRRDDLGGPCRTRLLSWERCCPPSDRCAPCASRTASWPSAGGWRRRCVSIGSQWTPG